MMRTMQRTEAKRRGLKRYFTGRPCKHGHVAERFVNNAGCVECHRARMRAQHRVWYAAHSIQEHRARNRAWDTAYPDRRAALSGLYIARRTYPGCVPPDFDLDATIPFYRKARRLTRKSGIKYVVCHVRALSLGGKHHARNLEVRTRKDCSPVGRMEKIRR